MIRATGRENSPSVRRMPPANSIAPANQYIVNTGGVGSGDGNPTMRDRPCSRNKSAALMRRMLSTYGARRAGKESSVTHRLLLTGRLYRSGVQEQTNIGVMKLLRDP